MENQQYMSEKEDVEYVSREEFEAKNKSTLNNAEYLKL